MDLDNVVDREDQQLQTVGHHWPLDGPLPREMRDNMERTGVCLSCHREIPEGRFVYQVISRVGDALGMVPKTDAEHMKLIGKAMFIAANLQIFGPLAALLLVILFVFLFRKRNSYNSGNQITRPRHLCPGRQTRRHKHAVQVLED
jgi:hypothetical protein